MFVEGSYLDGKTSLLRPARLEVSGVHLQYFRLQIETPDEILDLEYQELRIESRLGNTPREILFRDGQLFVTKDNDAVDEFMLVNDPKRVSILHRMESNLALVVFAAIATLGVIWIAAVYGIPKMAEVIAYQLPDIATEKLGSSLDVMDRTLFEPSELEQARRDEIRELVAPYLKSHDHLHPRLVFRSGMKANAFALPGGEIVFTDDFVELTETKEELLAVFFHELGHLKYKHIARRALQDSMITLLVIFVTGDVSSVDLLTGLPTLILDLSYSREFETEADIYALSQMHQSGIPLLHFANVMQRLAQFYEPADGDQNIVRRDESSSGRGNSVPDFFSTHPATEDRVKLVDRYRKEHGLR